jgi:hypothetical protein
VPNCDRRNQSHSLPGSLRYKIHSFDQRRFKIKNDDFYYESRRSRNMRDIANSA